MASTASDLPEPYRADRRPSAKAFHVDELAGDLAGSFSPFGQDVEFPLSVDKLPYVHPGPRDRPHLAGD
jgi:hypothetical protein